MTEIAVADAQKLDELKEAIESKEPGLDVIKKLLNIQGAETEPCINPNVD